MDYCRSIVFYLKCQNEHGNKMPFKANRMCFYSQDKLVWGQEKKYNETRWFLPFVKIGIKP